MLACQDLCNRFASNMQYAGKWLRRLNKWKQIRTGSVQVLQTALWKDAWWQNGLELFHKMFSYKFIKKLNLLDILPHTTGRNHSSPNENIPGVRSQPVRLLTHTAQKPRQKKTTKKPRKQIARMAAQTGPAGRRDCKPSSGKNSCQLPNSDFRDWKLFPEVTTRKMGGGIRKAFSHRLFFLCSSFASQDGEKTIADERLWRVKWASDYVGVQLVSRTIFVVWPADDHISNIRESELSASTQHLALKLIEPLPAKDRSGK